MARSTRSICVYCGARHGARPVYTEAAHDVGQAIAAEGWRLVYGAGDVGLMGEVARSAQDAGAETFGVIPVHLVEREEGKTDLTSLVVTQTMHERKTVMFMNSDAIVVLPGGAGSLDEFFEMLTWRQLGLHRRPLLLLDTEGYWQPLLTLVDHVIAEGFASPGLRDHIGVVPDAASMVAALRDALS